MEMAATSQSGNICHQNGPARPARFASNRIVGEHLPRLSRQRRRRARAPGCQEYVGPLPGQRHGLKLRQRGRVVERRGIPCQQQVHVLVQQIARIAGRDQKPNGRKVVRATVIIGAAPACRSSSGAIRPIVFRAATANRRRAWRSPDPDGQAPSARLRVALQRDRQLAVADGGDRLDETTHVRPQLVADAVAGPARAHISGGHRRAVGETRVLAQGDDPGTSICVEPPRRCEARNRPSAAIHPNQRFVELTKQQPLALVRRARCVRWIDAVGEPHGRNRLTRFREQRTFVLAIVRGRSGVTAGAVADSVGVTATLLGRSGDLSGSRRTGTFADGRELHAHAPRER